LQPTASSVPRLLKEHVTAKDMQSSAPSNSYFIEEKTLEQKNLLCNKKNRKLFMSAFV
jgi:hypothetical protein